MAECQLWTTLTGEETNKIVAFLLILIGKQPAIVSPILPSSSENTPQAKQELIE